MDVPSSNKKKQGFSLTSVTRPTEAGKCWLSKILYACFDHTIADEDSNNKKDDPKNEEWL